MVDRLFWYLDAFMRGVADGLGKPSGHYCRLETPATSTSLSADDGSRVTLIELGGSMKLLDSDEVEAIVDALEADLTPRLQEAGHAIQILFDYDPDQAHDEVAESFRPMRTTARNLGFEVDGLLDDWVDAIAPRVAAERVWVALWTRPEVLPRAETARARRELGRPGPTGLDAQRPERIIEALENVHHGFVTTVVDTFSAEHLIHRLLEVHEALWWIRHSTDPEFTGRQWRASLPGDPLPIRHQDPGAPENDRGHLLYPAIHRQVIPREGEEMSRSVVRVGDRLHAPLILSLPPQTPMPFNVLFKRMLGKRIPYRVSMLIAGDGLGGMMLKNTLASILWITSPVNKQFKRALGDLEARKLDGEAIVRLQVTFDTWVNAADPDAERTLQKRVEELAAAVQGWGSCEVLPVNGDPMLGVAACIPGITAGSPADAAAPPLCDVIGMLPFTRPASPWESGSVVWRTPDGKIFPYALHSSAQASWIELGVAGMGSGKSVSLNVINLGFCYQPGLVELPHLGIIDIGEASLGLVELLRAGLPESKRHLAVYRRMRMTPKYAVNPFDTPLGCERPTPLHRAFLVNLLTLFATPLDADGPPEGMDAIARAVVDKAFDEYRRERNPKRYNPAMDGEVAVAVEEEGIRVDDHTSWWEVADALFDAGRVHEAHRAHRFAVPLVPEVGALARRNEVVDLYGEEAAERFWRAVIDAVSAYPILARPTQFDLGDARVISLNLEEVAPRGGAEADRQAGVMYMLARHIVGGKYFQHPDDVPQMPERYQAYHRERIEQMAALPKRLALDEFHRVSRNPSVAAQLIGDLETVSRESRTRNLSLGIYSQSIKDYPDIMIELATTMIILGANDRDVANEMARRFELNDGCRNAIMRLGKPSAKGANFVARMRTADGEVQQVLTTTIGPQVLWAFSTTAEDRRVRNKLYERIGVTPTLTVLGRHYPGGIKKTVEARRGEMGEVSVGEEIEDVIDVLARELAEAAEREGLTQEIA